MVIHEYQDEDGASPFSRWFDKLEARAAAKVTTALVRMENGNLSNVKGLGGIFECKIDYGPGYRVYLGRDGEILILLLGGGIKKTQRQDIQIARQRWVDYKRRKKTGKGE